MTGFVGELQPKSWWTHISKFIKSVLAHKALGLVVQLHHRLTLELGDNPIDVVLEGRWENKCQ